MTWAYLIIIALLTFIACQLFRMNQAREIERNKQAFQEKFPNLTKYANEDAKESLRSFLSQNETGYDLSKYLYTERFLTINRAIEAETDVVKKGKMVAAKEAVVKDLRESEPRLQRAVKAKTATEWETGYVLWQYLNAINKDFPDIDITLDDILILNGFNELLDIK